jgi:hypothetical protein
VHLYSGRYGRISGIMYKQNGEELAGNKVEQINEVLKRGMWKYDLKDPNFTE